jgi:sugar lactone lactonase YvrE
MGDIPVEVALHIRAQHAEGPLWDAATERMWWVDITWQRVHCYDPKSGSDISWSTAGQPGGVVLSTAGEPIVARPAGLVILDRETGGADGGDLYIVTSWLDLEEEDRAAHPLARAIVRCRLGVTGPPSPRFAGLPLVPEGNPQLTVT